MLIKLKLNFSEHLVYTEHVYAYLIHIMYLRLYWILNVIYACRNSKYSYVLNNIKNTTL